MWQNVNAKTLRSEENLHRENGPEFEPPPPLQLPLLIFLKREGAGVEAGNEKNVTRVQQSKKIKKEKKRKERKNKRKERKQAKLKGCKTCTQRAVRL